MTEANQTQMPQVQPVAVFWRRIFAAGIDGIILFIIGLILGHFFGGLFIQMERWGCLIGFLVVLLYSGALNSIEFGGQTLGKKILSIQVVDK